MIVLERDERVAIVTIDRPQRRNALASDVVTQIERMLAQLDADEAVGAVVLTGAAPSFCAGSDLKELGTLDLPGMVDHELETGRVARQIGMLETPVIAAVEGHALGGGFILAMSCDLVVSAEDAKWSLPEVPNGWLPPWGLKALASRVGNTTARRLAWGFEVLDGPTAMRLGVADYCVAPGAAVQSAIELAKKIAQLPPNAVTSAKLYFQAEVLKDAELWDQRAARAFAHDCAAPASKSTLEKFRK